VFLRLAVCGLATALPFHVTEEPDGPPATAVGWLTDNTSVPYTRY
jgi:hypothetical protein